jgi:hypothetical protein
VTTQRFAVVSAGLGQSSGIRLLAGRLTVVARCQVVEVVMGGVWCCWVCGLAGCGGRLTPRDLFSLVGVGWGSLLWLCARRHRRDCGFVGFGWVVGVLVRCAVSG